MSKFCQALKTIQDSLIRKGNFCKRSKYQPDVSRSGGVSEEIRLKYRKISLNFIRTRLCPSFGKFDTLFLSEIPPTLIFTRELSDKTVDKEVNIKFQEKLKKDNGNKSLIIIPTWMKRTRIKKFPEGSKLNNSKSLIHPSNQTSFTEDSSLEPKFQLNVLSKEPRIPKLLNIPQKQKNFYKAILSKLVLPNFQKKSVILKKKSKADHNSYAVNENSTRFVLQTEIKESSARINTLQKSGTNECMEILGNKSSLEPIKTDDHSEESQLNDSENKQKKLDDRSRIRKHKKPNAMHQKKDEKTLKIKAKQFEKKHNPAVEFYLQQLAVKYGKNHIKVVKPKRFIYENNRQRIQFVNQEKAQAEPEITLNYPAQKKTLKRKLKELTKTEIEKSINLTRVTSNYGYVRGKTSNIPSVMKKETNSWPKIEEILNKTKNKILNKENSIVNRGAAARIQFTKKNNEKIKLDKNNGLLRGREAFIKANNKILNKKKEKQENNGELRIVRECNKNSIDKIENNEYVKKIQNIKEIPSTIVLNTELKKYEIVNSSKNLPPQEGNNVESKKTSEILKENNELKNVEEKSSTPLKILDSHGIQKDTDFPLIALNCEISKEESQGNSLKMLIVPTKPNYSNENSLTVVEETQSKNNNLKEEPQSTKPILESSMKDHEKELEDDETNLNKEIITFDPAHVVDIVKISRRKPISHENKLMRFSSHRTGEKLEIPGQKSNNSGLETKKYYTVSNRRVGKISSKKDKTSTEDKIKIPSQGEYIQDQLKKPPVHLEAHKLSCNVETLDYQIYRYPHKEVEESNQNNSEMKGQNIGEITELKDYKENLELKKTTTDQNLFNSRDKEYINFVTIREADALPTKTESFESATHLGNSFRNPINIMRIKLPTLHSLSKELKISDEIESNFTLSENNPNILNEKSGGIEQNKNLDGIKEKENVPDKSEILEKIGTNLGSSLRNPINIIHIKMPTLQFKNKKTDVNDEIKTSYSLSVSKPDLLKSNLEDGRKDTNLVKVRETEEGHGKTAIFESINTHLGSIVREGIPTNIMHMKMPTLQTESKDINIKDEIKKHNTISVDNSDLKEKIQESLNNILEKSKIDNSDKNKIYSPSGRLSNPTQTIHSLNNSKEEIKRTSDSNVRDIVLHTTNLDAPSMSKRNEQSVMEDSKNKQPIDKTMTIVLTMAEKEIKNQSEIEGNKKITVLKKIPQEIQNSPPKIDVNITEVASKQGRKVENEGSKPQTSNYCISKHATPSKNDLKLKGTAKTDLKLLPIIFLHQAYQESLIKEKKISNEKKQPLKNLKTLGVIPEQQISPKNIQELTGKPKGELLSENSTSSESPSPQSVLEGKKDIPVYNVNEQNTKQVFSLSQKTLTNETEQSKGKIELNPMINMEEYISKFVDKFIQKKLLDDVARSNMFLIQGLNKISFLKKVSDNIQYLVEEKPQNTTVSPKKGLLLENKKERDKLTVSEIEKIDLDLKNMVYKHMEMLLTEMMRKSRKDKLSIYNLFDHSFVLQNFNKVSLKNFQQNDFSFENSDPSSFEKGPISEPKMHGIGATEGKEQSVKDLKGNNSEVSNQIEKHDKLLVKKENPHDVSLIEVLDLRILPKCIKKPIKELNADDKRSQMYGLKSAVTSKHMCCYTKYRVNDMKYEYEMLSNDNEINDTIKLQNVKKSDNLKMGYPIGNNLGNWNLNIKHIRPNKKRINRRLTFKEIYEKHYKDPKKKMIFNEEEEEISEKMSHLPIRKICHFKDVEQSKNSELQSKQEDKNYGSDFELDTLKKNSNPSSSSEYFGKIDPEVQHYIFKLQNKKFNVSTRKGLTTMTSITEKKTAILASDNTITKILEKPQTEAFDIIKDCKKNDFKHLLKTIQTKKVISKTCSKTDVNKKRLEDASAIQKPDINIEKIKTDPIIHPQIKSKAAFNIEVVDSTHHCDKNQEISFQKPEKNILQSSMGKKSRVDTMINKYEKKKILEPNAINAISPELKEIKIEPPELNSIYEEKKEPKSQYVEQINKKCSIEGAKENPKKLENNTNKDTEVGRYVLNGVEYIVIQRKQNKQRFETNQDSLNIEMDSVKDKLQLNSSAITSTKNTNKVLDVTNKEQNFESTSNTMSKKESSSKQVMSRKSGSFNTANLKENCVLSSKHPVSQRNITSKESDSLKNKTLMKVACCIEDSNKKNRSNLINKGLEKKINLAENNLIRNKNRVEKINLQDDIDVKKILKKKFKSYMEAASISNKKEFESKSEEIYRFTENLLADNKSDAEMALKQKSVENFLDKVKSQNISEEKNLKNTESQHQIVKNLPIALANSSANPIESFKAEHISDSRSVKQSSDDSKMNIENKHDKPNFIEESDEVNKIEDLKDVKTLKVEDTLNNNVASKINILPVKEFSNKLNKYDAKKRVEEREKNKRVDLIKINLSNNINSREEKTYGPKTTITNSLTVGDKIKKEDKTFLNNHIESNFSSKKNIVNNTSALNISREGNSDNAVKFKSLLNCKDSKEKLALMKYISEGKITSTEVLNSDNINQFNVHKEHSLMKPDNIMYKSKSQTPSSFKAKNKKNQERNKIRTFSREKNVVIKSKKENLVYILKPQAKAEGFISQLRSNTSSTSLPSKLNRGFSKKQHTNNVRTVSPIKQVHINPIKPKSLTIKIKKTSNVVTDSRIARSPYRKSHVTSSTEKSSVSPEKKPNTISFPVHNLAQKNDSSLTDAPSRQACGLVRVTHTPKVNSVISKEKLYPKILAPPKIYGSQSLKAPSRERKYENTSEIARKKTIREEYKLLFKEMCSLHKGKKKSKSDSKPTILPNSNCEETIMDENFNTGKEQEIISLRKKQQFIRSKKTTSKNLMKTDSIHNLPTLVDNVMNNVREKLQNFPSSVTKMISPSAKSTWLDIGDVVRQRQVLKDTCDNKENDHIIKDSNFSLKPKQILSYNKENKIVCEEGTCRNIPNYIKKKSLNRAGYKMKTKSKNKTRESGHRRRRISDILKYKPSVSKTCPEMSYSEVLHRFYVDSQSHT